MSAVHTTDLGFAFPLVAEVGPLLEEEVDRKDVVHLIQPATTIGKLIQVSHFRSNRRMRTLLVAKADEGPILIQTCVRAPIGVVEMKEDLVPQDKRPLRAMAQDSLSASELSPAKTNIVAGFEPSLFKPAAVLKPPVANGGCGRPLLPKAMLIEVATNYRRCANPSVAGPQSLLLGQCASQSRPDDALIESVAIVAQTVVPIEPPAKDRVVVK